MDTTTTRGPSLGRLAFTARGSGIISVKKKGAGKGQGKQDEFRFHVCRFVLIDLLDAM
jgi:hypothetical protein